MNQYLIQFKPIEDFFFGGEVTFGDTETQNYLVKSNLFPQQTTLLGTLRKELLIQEGLLKLAPKGYELDQGKKSDIENLIGPESFDISKGNQNFGKIESVSPVFLVCNGSKDRQFYIPAPMNRLQNDSLKLHFDSGISQIGQSKPNGIPLIESYNPKEGIPDLLISSKDQTKLLWEVFMPSERVGIKKGEKGITEEKAFYKQTTYRLQKGFAFACIVQMRDKKLENSLVFMGADRSCFMMIVEEFQQSFVDLFGKLNPSPETQIILLSDTFVELEIYQNCKFAITQAVPFRNIKSSTGNYNYKSNKEKKLYMFFMRGSVLFPKDGQKNELQKMLNKESFQKIGYNIFC